jgi:hypothetical protein
MNEEWKSIPGYEGLYEASNLGEIRAVPRKGSNGRKLKAAVRKDGYLQVSLRKHGKNKSHLVHRLVAHSFISEEIGKHYVNHRDGNRLNNISSNLEWCTVQENCLHAHDVLQKNTKPVLCVETGVVYPSIRNAARAINYDNATIQRICACKGRGKTAGGYHWRYATN